MLSNPAVFHTRTSHCDSSPTALQSKVAEVWVTAVTVRLSGAGQDIESQVYSVMSPTSFELLPPETVAGSKGTLSCMT